MVSGQVLKLILVKSAASDVLASATTTSLQNCSVRGRLKNIRVVHFRQFLFAFSDVMDRTRGDSLVILGTFVVTLQTSQF